MLGKEIPILAPSNLVIFLKNRVVWLGKQHSALVAEDTVLFASARGRLETLGLQQAYRVPRFCRSKKSPLRTF